MDPLVLKLRRSLGGEFPYRALTQGTGHTIETLIRLLSANGEYTFEKWEIAPGHLVTNLPDFKTRFPLIDVVIGEMQWDLDKILDFYTEQSRMKTPGYGDTHSPYDYWTMKSLESRISRLIESGMTPSQLRENFYRGVNGKDKIPEARLAYATVSKGVYTVLKQLHSQLNVSSTTFEDKTLSVIDISAYGDRMVAAAGLGFIYTGIDPDSSLVSGHHQLKMDLSLAASRIGRSDPIIDLYMMPLEGFESTHQFDLMTISPPPFDMEPYGGSATTDAQTHVRYEDTESWFHGFLVELVLRAKKLVKPGGLFAFTALDRIPKKPGEKSITYVESLLLLAKVMDFDYIGAIGLTSKVPWWIFSNRPNPKRTEDLSLLFQYYPQRMPFARINAISPGLTIAIPSFDRDGFKGPSNIHRLPSPLLEFIRYMVHSSVVRSVSETIKIWHSDPENKLNLPVLIGRWLMEAISIDHADDLDPFFPSAVDTSSADDNLIRQLVTDKGVSQQVAEYTVKTSRYRLSNSTRTYVRDGVGLRGLVKAAALYMGYIVYLKRYREAIPFVTFIEKPEGTLLLTHVDRSTVVASFLRQEVPFGETVDFEVKGNQLVLWKGAMLPQRRFANGSAWNDPYGTRYLLQLRYHTLDPAGGHHYTRPMERIRTMEAIAGRPVIDLFANYLNANSVKYGSLYPDLEGELGSYGSSLSLSLPSGAYMVNPPDTASFLTRTAVWLQAQLDRNTEITFFIGGTLWDDTDSNLRNLSPDTLRNSLRVSSNQLFQAMADSPHLKAAYVLNTQTFYSVDPTKPQTRGRGRPNSFSFGLVISKSSLNLSLINQLGSSYAILP